MAKLTQKEKDRYAGIQRARKAAMYVSPKNRARKARKDAQEAERCRLRMLAVLNLAGDGTKWSDPTLTEAGISVKNLPRIRPSAPRPLQGSSAL